MTDAPHFVDPRVQSHPAITEDRPYRFTTSMASVFGGLEGGKCCRCATSLYPLNDPPIPNRRERGVYTYMPDFGYHDVGTHAMCDDCYRSLVTALNASPSTAHLVFDPGYAPCGYDRHRGHPARR